MKPPTEKPIITQESGNESPAPRLRSVVRKSALLNVAIVLTSFPVLVFAGGPQAVVPALAIMTGISVLIWAATFALFSFVSLARLLWAPASSAKPPEPPHPSDAGVADRWLDGPG